MSHKKDYAQLCEECINDESVNKKKIDIFDRELEFEGDLDEKQRKRLLNIANKCPVHRTLHGEVEVNTTLV